MKNPNLLLLTPTPAQPNETPSRAHLKFVWMDRP